jgi:hypothetical protein
MSAMDSSNELLSIGPALSKEQQFTIKLLLANKNKDLKNKELQLDNKDLELDKKDLELKNLQLQFESQKKEWEKNCGRRTIKYYCQKND